MSDYMMIEYLKNKGMTGHDDHELIQKFKEFMRHENSYKYNRDMMYNRDYYNRDKFEFDDFMDPEEKYYRRGYMRHNMEYLDETHAEKIVSEMYHKDKNEMIRGEHFNMHKAEEVYNKYKHTLGNATVEEVYIAINAQYHDYCALFKSWFGMTNIDEKIITSALVFWFKDPDYSKGSKVRNYFDI
jgi:cobalamin-dependent methionine synthase I